VVAGFAAVTRENVCFSLAAGSKKNSLTRFCSTCHAELSPRPRDFRPELSLEFSNHVSSPRVAPKKGLQRHHLVLQRVSDARARPGLPYLFRSAVLPATIHAREFPQSMRPFQIPFLRARFSCLVGFVSRFLPKRITCAVEKSHALCGIVCGAPREAFSPLFYPFFIWAFGPGKR